MLIFGRTSKATPHRRANGGRGGGVLAVMSAKMVAILATNLILPKNYYKTFQKTSKIETLY